MAKINMSIQKDIIEALRAFPNSTPVEIAELINSSKNSVKSAIRRMIRDKRIIQSKKPNPNPLGARMIYAYSVTEEPTKPIKLVGFKEPKKPDINLDMKRELEELRIWKERAILRFPELKVDPIVLLAREALAKHYDDKKQQEDILCGRCDTRPPMRAMIEVLSNAS